MNERDIINNYKNYGLNAILDDLQYLLDCKNFNLFNTLLRDNQLLLDIIYDIDFCINANAIADNKIEKLMPYSKFYTNGGWANCLSEYIINKIEKFSNKDLLTLINYYKTYEYANISRMFFAITSKIDISLDVLECFINIFKEHNNIIMLKICAENYPICKNFVKQCIYEIENAETNTI